MQNQEAKDFIKVQGVVIEPHKGYQAKDLLESLVIEDNIISTEDLEKLNFTQRIATLKYKKAAERDSITKFQNKLIH